MIDHIITFSVRRRWLVVLAAAAFALWGLRCALSHPRRCHPRSRENRVLVFTGSGPPTDREIEEQVTYPLSLELKGLDGVRSVRSSSDVGFSLVSVIFEDGVGPPAARRRVGEVLERSSLRLPEERGAKLAPDAAATGQIFWYTVEGAGHDPGAVACHSGLVRPPAAQLPCPASRRLPASAVRRWSIRWRSTPSPPRTA
jgi:Cu(I)/Ag(I) efflux system membrane protein CusA/SilA